jgi:hypothetical protein
MMNVLMTMMTWTMSMTNVKSTAELGESVGIGTQRSHLEGNAPCVGILVTMHQSEIRVGIV